MEIELDQQRGEWSYQRNSSLDHEAIRNICGKNIEAVKNFNNSMEKFHKTFCDFARVVHNAKKTV